MRLGDLARKLKAKDKKYSVTADQWYMSFTIYYGDAHVIHAYFETLTNRYGWLIEIDNRLLQDQLPILLEPLELLKNLEEPLSTDQMPLLDGFEGEREIII